MAVAGTPWQLECEKVEQRCGYLLTSGLWSDCTFMVGSETNQEVIQAHKLVLAMASPVFEAMFYGGLSDRNEPIVSIPDVQPEAFRALLQYMYTGNVNIDSFDMALDLWYGAMKYMLPHLAAQCTSKICSVVGPRNVFQAYEFAHLFEEKTVMDKCIQVISTNTKEVLNDSNFVNMEIKTLITVCSLDHLNVDELDLFHAVARYAEVEQRRQGQTLSESLSAPRLEPTASGKKVLLPGVESSSETSPAAELHSTPAVEVVTEPTADKKNLKEEPSIRAALQKLRFLSLSAAQFAEGPARSALLTQEEKLALIINIASGDSPVPMPTGFSECRERRQPSRDSQKTVQAQCFEAGSLDHTINALQCGVPSRVEDAVWEAANILNKSPRDMQPALDKGILDALVPALTKGSARCKEAAALAIYHFCLFASPAQLCVLAEGAALQPYCRLLADPRGRLCYWVLRGLTELLKQNVEQNIQQYDIVQKLRALGVPQLLKPLKQHSEGENRQRANNLLRNYFK